MTLYTVIYCLSYDLTSVRQKAQNRLLSRYMIFRFKQKKLITAPPYADNQFAAVKDRIGVHNLVGTEKYKWSVDEGSRKIYRDRNLQTPSTNWKCLVWHNFLQIVLENKRSVFRNSKKCFTNENKTKYEH